MVPWLIRLLSTGELDRRSNNWRPFGPLSSIGAIRRVLKKYKKTIFYYCIFNVPYRKCCRLAYSIGLNNVVCMGCHHKMILFSFIFYFFIFSWAVVSVLWTLPSSAPKCFLLCLLNSCLSVIKCM